MGEDKWPEGPTRRRWFERGREYERGRLDQAEEEDKEPNPLADDMDAVFRRLREAGDPRRRR
jgi:hypothetical protein